MSTDHTSLPETFEAWTWTGSGEPEALKRERLSLEAPGDQEVIVASRAIGPNPVDGKFIAMDSALRQPGQIPGVDAAGGGDGLKGRRHPRRTRPTHRRAYHPGGHHAGWPS